MTVGTSHSVYLTKERVRPFVVASEDASKLYFQHTVGL